MVCREASLTVLIKTRHYGKEITPQKLISSIMDFFSKCDQIRWKLGIWPHLLNISLMENFMFCAVTLGNVRCSSETHLQKLT